MNALPEDQPGSYCDNCPDADGDNGIAHYRPPLCTMTIVKDHSTLTLGATHSHINRKIMCLLIDLTIQINFILTMQCSQI